MKAFFITTSSNECDNHVAAWDSFNEPAGRFSYVTRNLRQDGQIEAAVRAHEPSVIFYIGACKGMGVPHPNMFCRLRDVAPIINLVSDAADQPWWPVLDRYKEMGSFDLQVAIDGRSDAPVDHYTVTAVDPGMFQAAPDSRDYDCGFSGTTGAGGPRFDLLEELGDYLIAVRHREAFHGYRDHAAFLMACRSILNTSWTGTGADHHIKGRVIEAGWAGAALLEHAASPIGDWFPPEAYRSYETADDVRRMLSEPSWMLESAHMLKACVTRNYTPQLIYGEILEKIGVVLAE